MYPRLRQFRESLGLTQEEFGKSVGVAKSTYNNYETGIRDPKSDFWIAVAQKYHVTIDYLMGYSEISSPSKGEKTLHYSSEALKLAQDYDALDEHGQRVLRVVADEEKARIAQEANPTLTEPPGEPEDPDIEAEIAEYRRQLLLEKEAKARSSATTDAGADTNIKKMA